MMDNPSLLPCGECAFRAQSPLELEVHRAQSHSLRKPCSVAGCSRSFTVKRELDDHLVTEHFYCRCLDAKCRKVFKQRSRMEAHFAKHGCAIPTRPVMQPAPSPAAAGPDPAGELTADTYRYLLALRDLAAGLGHNEACMKLIGEVLQGVEKDGNSALATSLYLRAIQVALALPQAARTVETVEPQRPAPSLTSSIDSLSTRPENRVSRRNSSLSDDPEDSDFGSSRVCQKRKCSPRAEEPRKRSKKSYSCAICGEVCSKKKELAKHCSEHHAVKDLAPKAQSTALTVPAKPSTFICIEEPCDLTAADAPVLGLQVCLYPPSHQVAFALTARHHHVNIAFILERKRADRRSQSPQPLLRSEDHDFRVSAWGRGRRVVQQLRHIPLAEDTAQAVLVLLVQRVLHGFVVFDSALRAQYAVETEEFIERCETRSISELRLQGNKPLREAHRQRVHPVHCNGLLSDHLNSLNLFQYLDTLNRNQVTEVAHLQAIPETEIDTKLASFGLLKGHAIKLKLSLAGLKTKAPTQYAPSPYQQTTNYAGAGQTVGYQPPSNYPPTYPQQPATYPQQPATYPQQPATTYPQQPATYTPAPPSYPQQSYPYGGQFPTAQFAAKPSVPAKDNPLTKEAEKIAGRFRDIENLRTAITQSKDLILGIDIAGYRKTLEMIGALQDSLRVAAEVQAEAAQPMESCEEAEKKADEATLVE